MKYPVISSNPAVQAHYEAARREGTSHSLAEMFALGQGPTLKTDATFLAGLSTNGSQFENTPHFGDYYAAEARKHGQDPKGKVYLSGLAAFPGDPEAWVEGRADIKRVAEKRGWGVRGAVDVKVCTEGPPLPSGPAEDLVAERMQRMVANNPELAHADQGELAHEATESLKPAWAK